MGRRRIAQLSVGLLVLGTAGALIGFRLLKFGPCKGDGTCNIDPQTPAQCDAGARCIKWGTMPVNYRINSAGTLDISGTRERAPIRTSFQSWENISTAAITFTDGGTTSNEQNCDFHPTVFWSTTEAGNALAKTIFCGQQGSSEILDADIVLNDDAVWRIGTQHFFNDGNTNSSDTLDVQSIVTHEVGHVLGIGHSESSDTNPSTAPTMSDSATVFDDNLHERTLESDDRQAAAFLYPAGGGGGPDDATFISTTLPSSATPGDIVIGEITMKNTGTSTWQGSNGYKLAAKDNPNNPYDYYDDWPVCYSCQVSPGSNYTFTVYVPYTMDIGGDPDLLLPDAEELDLFWGAV